jgi:hypothetical protein
MPTAYTPIEILALLPQGAASRVDIWLRRGDGIAVYENRELGHPDLGHRQIVSYGSPAAQLETTEPPTTLPDIGGAINWRYQLVGTYRGAPGFIEEA